jgi:hypothetical protein
MVAMIVAVYWLSPRRNTHPAIVFSCVAPLLLYLLWPILRAFATGVALEITDRGIMSHVGSVTFVAWEEIQDARLGSWWGTPQVELELRDSETVLARVGGFRGWSLRKAVKKYGMRPAIAASLVQGGPEAVLSAIRAKVAITAG